VTEWISDLDHFSELVEVWVQFEGIPPRWCDWKVFAQMASGLGLLLDVDWSALFKSFYEKIRVKIACRNPRKIPGERLFELDKKLYLVTILVEGFESKDADGRADEDNNGDDDDDKKDEVDGASDDRMETEMNPKSASSGLQQMGGVSRQSNQQEKQKMLGGLSETTQSAQIDGSSDNPGRYESKCQQSEQSMEIVDRMENIILAGGGMDHGSEQTLSQDMVSFQEPDARGCSSAGGEMMDNCMSARFVLLDGKKEQDRVQTMNQVHELISHEPGDICYLYGGELIGEQAKVQKCVDGSAGDSIKKDGKHYVQQADMTVSASLGSEDQGQLEQVRHLRDKTLECFGQESEQTKKWLRFLEEGSRLGVMECPC
jgi:hypothetical protein